MKWHIIKINKGGIFMIDIKLTNEVISPKDKRDSLVDKVEVG